MYATFITEPTVAGVSVTGQSLAVLPTPLYFGVGANVATDFTAVANPIPTATITQQAIMGVDEACGQLPFLYCPAGTNFSMVVFHSNAAVATSIDVRVTVEKWDGPGTTRVFTPEGYNAGIAVSKSGGFATFSVPSGGWYRAVSIDVVSGAIFAGAYEFRVQISCTNSVPTYIASVVTGGTISFGVAVTTPMLMPIANPPEFNTSVLPYQSTRTTAVSALFTNVTKALNKEGTVLWGRINPNNRDPYSFTSSDLSVLHPSEKAYLPLETGSYTFVAPSTDMATFWDYNWKGIPIIRLDNDSLVNAGYFSDPDGGTNLAITADWHFEFRTTSALFEIGLSSITLETFHQAQLSLVQAGFFYPNSTHRELLARVTRYAVSAAAAMFPQVKWLQVGSAAAKALYNNRASLRPPPARSGKQKRKQVRAQPPPKKQIKPRSGPSHPRATTLQTKTEKKKGGLDMFFEKYPDRRPR